MKDGKETTEFYVKVVTQILGFVLTVLAFYGVLTADEVGLWQSGVLLIVPVLVSLIMTWSSNNYTDNRTQLKVQNKEAELEVMRLESAALEAVPTAGAPSVWTLDMQNLSEGTLTVSDSPHGRQLWVKLAGQEDEQ